MINEQRVMITLFCVYMALVIVFLIFKIKEIWRRKHSEKKREAQEIGLEIYIDLEVPECMNLYAHAENEYFYTLDGFDFCKEGEKEEWSCPYYCPTDDEYPTRCSNIGYKRRIIKKLCKQFEYDEYKGIAMGKNFYPAEWINKLVIDGETLIDRLDLEEQYNA